MDETKSARSRRVGLVRGVCGVARLGRSAHYVLRRAPCIRTLAKPTRLTRNTQTGSWAAASLKSSDSSIQLKCNSPPLPNRPISPMTIR
jgi:hypothetical protein